MKFFAVAALLSFTSFSSNAGWLHTDYLVDGDKKASLDTETGLEWLKLNNIKGMSLDSILEETSYGGSLSGWRLPTEDEVTVLMNGLYRRSGVTFETGEYQAETGDSKMSSWFTFMGTNKKTSYIYDANHPSSYKLYTYGITIKEDGSLSRNGYYSNERYVYGTDWVFNGGISYSSDEAISDIYSYFLVSDGGTTLSSKENPELNINNPNAPVNDVPMSTFLYGVSLLGVGFLKRKKS